MWVVQDAIGMCYLEKYVLKNGHDLKRQEEGT